MAPRRSTTNIGSTSKAAARWRRRCKGLERLRAAGLEPGLISVCNPGTDPERVLAFVVDELGIKQFDILPPDATHADNPPPIADYFIKLFDVWFDKYAAQGVRIDTLDAMIRGLVGSCRSPTRSGSARSTP